MIELSLKRKLSVCSSLLLSMVEIVIVFSVYFCLRFSLIVSVFDFPQVFSRCVLRSEEKLTNLTPKNS